VQSETNETPTTQGTDPAASSSPAGEASAASAGETTQADAALQPTAARGVEDTLRDAGTSIETAAKDLGAKLDAKLAESETGREVKQKLGGFFRKIQETIK
jgi:hypothetical protein